MRKILAMLIVAIMVATALPAMAVGLPTGYTDYYHGENPITVDTTVTVPGPSGGGGSGNPPIIKCKWETPDDDLFTTGIQIFPVLDGVKEVTYWAIVTDPEGVDTVADVYVDVYNPASPVGDGQLKYELELHKVNHDTGISKFLSAWDNDCIVTTNDNYFNGMSREEIKAEIWHELNESTAYVYKVTGELTYCQVAGNYRVSYIAYDIKDNPSARLENHFCYVPTAGIEIDFTSVDYETVDLHYWKVVSGDYKMDTPLKPTVRGIGNTNVKLKVYQDDMGLGTTGGNYNVKYKARMDEGTYVEYDPYEEATLNEVLPRCTVEKLDFGILVDKAYGGAGTYTGSMTITPIVEGNYGCCQPQP